MHITIAEKNTTFRMELKLSIITWSQVWPSSTTNRANERIIRLRFKKTSMGSLVRDDPRWEAVDKKHSRLKSFIPEL